MGSLADRTLRELLADVAADTPAPGGGSSSAVAAGLAAALVEMSAGVARARADLAAVHLRMSEIRERAAQLRAEALELADRDRTSYAPVLEALRAPGQAGLDEALSAAAETPMAIARLAAEVAGLAREVARIGARELEGDADAGAQLSTAACRAAGRLVELNLAGRSDDPRRAEVERLVAT